MSDTSIAQNTGFLMLPNCAVDDERFGGYDLLVYMALIRHAIARSCGVGNFLAITRPSESSRVRQHPASGHLRTV